MSFFDVKSEKIVCRKIKEYSQERGRCSEHDDSRVIQLQKCQDVSGDEDVRKDVTKQQWSRIDDGAMYPRTTMQRLQW